MIIPITLLRSYCDTATKKFRFIHLPLNDVVASLVSLYSSPPAILHQRIPKYQCLQTSLHPTQNFRLKRVAPLLFALHILGRGLKLTLHSRCWNTLTRKATIEQRLCFAKSLQITMQMGVLLSLALKTVAVDSMRRLSVRTILPQIHVMFSFSNGHASECQLHFRSRALVLERY